MVIKALTFLSKAITAAFLLGVVCSHANTFEVDSDGDGISDVMENRHGLDPNKPYDVWRDNDEDHLPNIQEYILGLDANSKDNDIYTNQRLLVMSAVVDIQSKIASNKQVEALLKADMKPAQLYQHLLDEPYFANMGFIGRVYQAILYRQADLDGARYYHHMLLNGMSKLQMVQQFLGSKEFQSTYGELSNEQFIDLAHLNIVGQSPLSEDADFFSDLMNNQGLSRAQLLLVFIDSSDYIKALDVQKRLEMLGLLLTGEVPDEQNSRLYRQWLIEENAMHSILRAMLSTDGYRQKRMGRSGALDSDGDGKTDAMEFVDGSDITGKDNDVLGNDLAFVRQVLWDIKGKPSSQKEVTFQLTQLNKYKHRSKWLLSLIGQYELGNSAELVAKLLPQGGFTAIDESTVDALEVLNQVIDSEAFGQRFY